MKIVNDILKGISKHSPELCIATSAVLFVGSLYFAIRATPEADKVVKKAKKKIEETTSAVEKKEVKKDTAKTLGKLYAPAIATSVGCLTTMILSNRLSAARNVALSVAYGATKELLTDYQDEVKKELGEKKEHDIRDRVAEKHADLMPSAPLVIQEGDWVIYDSITKEKFISNANKVTEAVNRINYRMMQENWISLSDLYYELSQRFSSNKMAKAADYLGWSIDSGLIEIYFTYDADDNGHPVAILNYNIEPRDIYKADIYGR